MATSWKTNTTQNPGSYCLLFCRHWIVNLLGVIYTTKLAIHYFAKQPNTKRFQLVLTGSAACFLDTPPLWTYCATKVGVMGLMRSLRTQMPTSNGVTVNMVAPWMTST